jgi:hypothetical protein
MIAFFRYFTSAILLLLLTLFLCDARVLPKIKRDNTTCCGYTITNRDNVYFKNKYEMDFSTVGLPSGTADALRSDSYP